MSLRLARPRSPQGGKGRRPKPFSIPAVRYSVTHTAEIRFHWRSVLRWMFFFCGPAAIFYLIVVYSLSYVTRQLGVPTQDSFALLMGANICAIVGARREACSATGSDVGARWRSAPSRHSSSCSFISPCSRPAAFRSCWRRWAHSLGSPSSKAVSSRSPSRRPSRPMSGIPARPRVHRRQFDRRRPDAGARRVAGQRRERLALGHCHALRWMEHSLARNDPHRAGNVSAACGVPGNPAACPMRSGRHEELLAIRICKVP